MGISKLSIKALTFIALITIGVSSVVLLIISGETFRSTSLEQQTQTLSRIIEVAATEEVKKLHKQLTLMGAETENDRAFRKAARNPTDTQNQNILITRLDDQYAQRWVTAGKIDLIQLRLYDKNFKLISQSSKGVNDLPPKLPDYIYQQAKDRKGGERLKTLYQLWVSDKHGALLSTMVPVGGLRLRGYLEVVTNPAHNLKAIEEVLATSIKLVQRNDSIAYKSEKWQEAHENNLIVGFELKAHNDKPALKIEINEDVTELNEKFFRALVFDVIGVFVIITAVIAAIYFIFRKFVFTPLNDLVSNMERSGNGDLTINIENNGLKELQILSVSLGKLVKSLHKQISDLHDNSKQLAASSDDMARITSESNQAIQQQQMETEQVATAINEMSATVQEVANHSEEAVKAAQNADNETSQGKGVVDKTISQINTLSDGISNTSLLMEELKKESENIGSVMDVIQGIAEQTNLLALNAAIEAARAGEQGRGFAVVADEVRTLAKRTQDSTHEIQSMIEKIQSGASKAMTAMEDNLNSTKETVEQAQTAGESLDTITSAVTSITDMNTQIASAAEEQNAVAQEISRSIEKITEVAHITSQGSKDTAKAGESLADLSEKFIAVVRQFKV